MNKVILVCLLVLFFTLPLFAQSVDTAWVRRYNGPDSAGEESRAIAVDGYGNVYITGHSDHNPNPPHNWDFTTIKYYQNGDTAWVRRYNGPGDAEDCGSAIAADDTGYVYVTGWSIGTGGVYGCLTIKYRSIDGDTVWMRRYNGPLNSGAGGLDLAIDNSGNVYVTGIAFGDGDMDYLTIKYHSNGDTAWARTYNGAGDYTDMCRKIAVDASGNIYVTGVSYGYGTDYDYATIKYLPSGIAEWIKTYDGQAHGHEEASDITVAVSGNVYVTGNSFDSLSDADFLTVKYYPNGDTAWIRRYNNIWNTGDYGYNLALDNEENIFVAGISGGHNFVIKYNSDGDTIWTRRYQSDTMSDTIDLGPSIVTDTSGNLYLAGAVYNTQTYYWDYLTIKYMSNGDTAWTRIFNGTGNISDIPTGIAVDNSGCYGSVYVTGWSWSGAETYNDFATIKYAQFQCGDANRDCKVSVSDIVYLISYLFKGGSAPLPLQGVGDANCDGKVSVSDIVYLISYLFKGGAPPCC